MASREADVRVDAEEDGGLRLVVHDANGNAVVFTGSLDSLKMLRDRIGDRLYVAEHG